MSLTYHPCLSSISLLFFFFLMDSEDGYISSILSYYFIIIDYWILTHRKKEAINLEIENYYCLHLLVAAFSFLLFYDFLFHFFLACFNY